MSEVIRTYQNTAAGEIARFEGPVAKFLGDGVLGYFGWPRAHEDEAERAVRAGLRQSHKEGLSLEPCPGQSSGALLRTSGPVIPRFAAHEDELRDSAASSANATSVRPTALRIDLPLEANGIAVLALPHGPWAIEAFDATGASVGQASMPGGIALAQSQLSVQASGIRRIDVGTYSSVAILAVCVRGVSPDMAVRRTGMEQVLERFKSERSRQKAIRRYPSGRRPRRCRSRAAWRGARCR
jgi:hypothetical protein